MSDNSETPCYIARCQCGCGGMIFASVDDAEMREQRAKETAKEIGKLVRDGYTVERATVKEVRSSKWFCQKNLDEKGLNQNDS